MAIEITSGSQCDATGCRATLHIGDSCYCESCYQELLDEIAELKKEIENLTSPSPLAIAARKMGGG
jgi:hypothetical protein